MDSDIDTKVSRVGNNLHLHLTASYSLEEVLSYQRLQLASATFLSRMKAVTSRNHILSIKFHLLLFPTTDMKWGGGTPLCY